MKCVPFKSLFWNVNDSVVNLMYYNRYCFMMQALLEKYVKLSHRKQMQKTYDDIKVNFQIDCRTDAGFWFNL